MRILLASRFDRQVGGVETYLARMVPLFESAGHEIALAYEHESDEDRSLIPLASAGNRHLFSPTTKADSLRKILAWCPDVIFIHHFDNPDIERQLIACAPAVFFAHDYNRTCVSGGKTFKSPQVYPCSRNLGFGCLALFFPRRCGGMNPVSMLRDFRQKLAKVENLKACKAIVTHSDRMRSEFVGLGFEESKVLRVGFHVDPPEPMPVGQKRELGDTIHLLYLGRMDQLKGASVLVESLPAVVAGCGKNVHLHLAGDGPDVERIQESAARVESENLSVAIEFHGWVDSEARQALFEKCHLMVVPSLWPEPFGQVGLEAGFFGVPAAAYRVGGIPDWLREGVNGHLAPANPPTPSGLADAVVRCVSNEDNYQSLSRGAKEVALEYAGDSHLKTLLGILENAARRDG